MAIIEGFGWGLAMVVFIGPVFFTLLKATLQHGVVPGMLVAWGIFISDVVCVGLCAFGALPFFENEENQVWLALIGSVILFGIGFSYLLKPKVEVKEKGKFNPAQLSSFFAKGYLVNFVNPFVFLVWIGVIGYAQKQYGQGDGTYQFLSAALLGVLTTDSLKVVFANKLKPLIKPEFLLKVYRVIGLIMIVFGGRLVYWGWNHWV